MLVITRSFLAILPFYAPSINSRKHCKTAINVFLFCDAIIFMPSVKHYTDEKNRNIFLAERQACGREYRADAAQYTKKRAAFTALL